MSKVVQTNNCDQIVYLHQIAFSKFITLNVIEKLDLHNVLLL